MRTGIYISQFHKDKKEFNLFFGKYTTQTERDKEAGGLGLGEDQEEETNKQTGLLKETKTQQAHIFCHAKF